jgi:hypothetical protein
MMARADSPFGIDRARHQDLTGRNHHVWWRRGTLAVIAAIPVLALLNVFGQRPHIETATAGSAQLELYTTPHMRGGLLVEARFTVTAKRDLKNATLELDRGWMEGITINTIEPSPLGEGSHDGKLVLQLGHVPRGQKHVLYMQLQVNPTNVGRRTQDVSLYDGQRLITTIHRRVTIFP